MQISKNRTKSDIFFEKLRENLFSSPLNIILTFLATILSIVIIAVVGNFIFSTADWAVISVNLRLFFIGGYPSGEEWRLIVALYVFAILVAVSFGIWLGKRSFIKYLIAVSIVAIIMLVLGFDWVPKWLNALSLGFAVGNRLPEVCANPTFAQQVQVCESAATVADNWLAGWLVTLGLFLILILGAIVAQFAIRPRRTSPITKSLIFTGWTLVVPLTILLQIGTTIQGQGIETSNWKAYFLDLLLFSVGVVFSLPLGILLALARTSSYRILSLAATVYIEIMRSGPLLIWLFLARFLWSDFFFSGIANTSIAYRVMFIFAIFGAAYIAEIIRGGLQSIPSGQHEASKALSLGTTRMNITIILPQAVQAVIPSIIGRMIALWKDTAIVLAIGLTNTLQISKIIRSGQAAITTGHTLEVIVFIALLYWIVSFALSRLGFSYEKKLKVGTQRN